MGNMLERPKTYGECDDNERRLIHAAYGGPLPDDTVVHLDRGYLVIENLNLNDVAKLQAKIFLEC